MADVNSPHKAEKNKTKTEIQTWRGISLRERMQCCIIISCLNITDECWDCSLRERLQSKESDLKHRELCRISVMLTQALTLLHTTQI